MTVKGMTVVFVALTGLCMVLMSLSRFLPDKTLSAHAPRDEAPAKVPTVIKEGAVEPIPEPATRPRLRVPTVVDPRIQAVIAAAVVDTVDHVPEDIVLRRVSENTRRRLAVLAAVTADTGAIPGSVLVEKVERRQMR